MTVKEFIEDFVDEKDYDRVFILDDCGVLMGSVDEVEICNPYSFSHNNIISISYKPPTYDEDYRGEGIYIMVDNF